MWFLRKATGTVLHNLELLFRGKKKSEVLVSSSLNEFDLMALYLILIATGKRNCLYWKIPRLESRLTTGSLFHLFRWRWPAEPGCCVVGFRTLCAHLFERFSDAKSVRLTNYSSIPKVPIAVRSSNFLQKQFFSPNVVINWRNCLSFHLLRTRRESDTTFYCVLQFHNVFWLL